MNNSDGYFKGVKGRSYYYRFWQPEHQAKAVLIIVHGMGEHSGRYKNLVNHFITKGVALYALDHRGHGRSEGRRKFIDSFDDFLEPLRRFHLMVKRWQPGIPAVIVGHSMGGTITLKYLKQYQDEFSGAVLSSPGLKPYGGVSALSRIAVKLLSKVWPTAGVLPIRPESISRDPAVVAAYKADPLVSKKRTPACLVAEMIDAMDDIQKDAASMNLPFIIVQGGSDTIVDPSGAQAFYDRAGSNDKTIKVYSGLYHEVFNELEQKQVLNDVEIWLDRILDA